MTDAENTLSCLISSGVIGLNEDGSAWVNGGTRGDGTVAWRRGQRYAAAGSPMADTIRRLKRAR